MDLIRVYGGRVIDAVSMVGYFKIELGAERRLLCAYEKAGAGQCSPFIPWLCSRKTAMETWNIGMP